MTCICQPLRQALENRYMTPDEIIRAAAILIHRRGAKKTLTCLGSQQQFQAADDVAEHANIPISSAFAKPDERRRTVEPVFFPYSGNKPDSTWQHIAHAAIHGIVMTDCSTWTTI